MAGKQKSCDPRGTFLREDVDLDDPTHTHRTDLPEPFRGRGKPQSSLGRMDIGRHHPEALNELLEQEVKMYQQDTRITSHGSSVRFDM